MARGNVCTHGEYEGVFYIPNDYLQVFKRNDPDDPYGECEQETRLLHDISSEELKPEEWLFDDEGSANEEEDVLECFMSDFVRRYPSFERVKQETWLDGTRRILLESALFYVVVEDNEWSLAIELVQKDEGYGSLVGLQGQHFERYLDGMKRALLERVPRIGLYAGAWTSGSLTKEELT